MTLDGRFGIVLGRLDGPTLLQLTRSGGVTFAQAGAILASLGLSVHRMSPPPGAFDPRGWMDTAFRLSGDIVPKHIDAGIRALIDRLQHPGDGLCHGDIHPENVIMTADGPRLIDWTFSIRAPAAFDHGHFHINLTELALDVTDNPQRPLAVYVAAQSEYARLSGMPVAALRQAMETWLPITIVRYFLLMGGPTSERWRRMMQSAEAALRPQDRNPSSRARGRRRGSVSALGQSRRSGPDHGDFRSSPGSGHTSGPVGMSQRCQRTKSLRDSPRRGGVPARTANRVAIVDSGRGGLS